MQIVELKFSQEFSQKSLDCWNPDSIILKIKKNLRLEEKQCAVCAASQGQAIDLLRMRYGPGPCQHRCREAQLLCPNFYIDVYRYLEKMRTSAIIWPP